MPCYTYKCLKCDEEFEAFHMMGEQLEICSQLVEANCEQSQVETGDVELCDGELVRLLSPVTKKKKILSKTGDIIKQEIKDSKYRIEEAKKEFKREYER
mgnify:CR=1 FL=1